MVERDKSARKLLEKLNFKNDVLWKDHGPLWKVFSNFRRFPEDLEKINDGIKIATRVNPERQRSSFIIFPNSISVEKLIASGDVAEIEKNRSSADNLVFREPAYFRKGLTSEDQSVQINGAAAFEKGASIALNNIRSYGTLYACEGAWIDNSYLEGSNFIGKNSVLQSLERCRNSFTGENCWIHAHQWYSVVRGSGISTDNYAGVSGGTNTVLHPLRGGDPVRVIDPVSLEPLQINYRAPILIGTRKVLNGADQNTTVGSNTTLRAGSWMEAGTALEDSKTLEGAIITKRVGGKMHARYVCSTEVDPLAI